MVKLIIAVLMLFGVWLRGFASQPVAFARLFGGQSIYIVTVILPTRVVVY